MPWFEHQVHGSTDRGRRALQCALRDKRGGRPRPRARSPTAAARSAGLGSGLSGRKASRGEPSKEYGADAVASSTAGESHEALKGQVRLAARREERGAAKSTAGLSAPRPPPASRKSRHWRGLTL